MKNIYKVSAVLILASLCVMEPVLANKFETISGGVNGSFRMKKHHIETGLLIMGGVFFFMSFLSIVVPRNNSSHLNYSNWKMSAAILAIMGSIALIGSRFI